jgi:hypothetical protein
MCALADLGYSYVIMCSAAQNLGCLCFTRDMLRMIIEAAEQRLTEHARKAKEQTHQFVKVEDVSSVRY